MPKYQWKDQNYDLDAEDMAEVVGIKEAEDGLWVTPDGEEFDDVADALGYEDVKVRVTATFTMDVVVSVDRDVWVNASTTSDDDDDIWEQFDGLEARDLEAAQYDRKDAHSFGVECLA